MKRCVLALLALALCNLLFHGTAQAAPKQAASDAVRVAVLPFQINGGADLNYLNDELPKLFEQRLAQKGFKVIPAKDTLRLLKNQQISQLNLATARSIARQAGANYAVYGSFSKTGDAFSIDARMVDAAGQQGAQPYFVQKQNMIELLPAVDELVDKMGGGAVKGDAITDIQIRGVKVLDPDVVLMRLSTRKGDVVDPSTLNEEIKRIWDLGYFSDVNADIEQGVQGLRVVLVGPLAVHALPCGGDALHAQHLPDVVDFQHAHGRARFLHRGLHAVVLEHVGERLHGREAPVIDRRARPVEDDRFNHATPPCASLRRTRRGCSSR